MEGFIGIFYDFWVLRIILVFYVGGFVIVIGGILLYREGIEGIKGSIKLFFIFEIFRLRVDRLGRGETVRVFRKSSFIF